MASCNSRSASSAVVPQHALGGSAERDLVGLRNSLPARGTTDDVAAKVVECATGVREDPAAKSVAFGQHPEEKVLRLDGEGTELADFGTSVEEDLKRS